MLLVKVGVAVHVTDGSQLPLDAIERADMPADVSENIRRAQGRGALSIFQADNGRHFACGDQNVSVEGHRAGGVHRHSVNDDRHIDRTDGRDSVQRIAQRFELAITFSKHVHAPRLWRKNRSALPWKIASMSESLYPREARIGASFCKSAIVFRSRGVCSV